MDVKESFKKNKELFIAIGLILALFIITGSILLFRWYIKRKNGRMANKGIQQSTIDFLKEREGVRYESYKDVVGLDTIGVGHLILPTEPELLHQKLTDQDVDTILRKDMESSVTELSRDIQVPLNQNQFDALISFIHGGIGNFRNSTLRKYINEKKSKEEITAAWMMWVKVKDGNGNLVFNKGLENRRKAEVNLFFS